MRRQMIKVGISCGDNGVTSKQILQTFSEAQIFELCVPIVYDYSTVLPYHRKTSRLSYIRTTNIHHANESIKDSLNVINISNKTAVPKNITTESSITTEESVYKGLSDLKAGEIDVFVVSSKSSDSLQQIASELSDDKKSLPILTNDYFRIVEISDSISVDILIEKIKILHSVLLRDFIVTFPRIAILSMSSPIEIIFNAIQISFQKGIFCFGIFDAEVFFNSGTYKKFDAALIVNPTPTNFTFQSIQPVNNETNVVLISNLPYVVTVTSADALLSMAIYLAIDTYRNRKNRSIR